MTLSDGTLQQLDSL